MKKLKTFFASVLLIFAFVLTAESQNNSNESSEVIDRHQTFNVTALVNCPDKLVLTFSGQVHNIIKYYPNGKWSYHINAYLEGVDEEGGLWKWHSVNNQKAVPGCCLTHVARNLEVVGPKGAKFKLSWLFVMNGNGEIVHNEFDPICD